MFKDRVTKALHHQKAFKPVIQKGIPSKSEGNNGDLRICQVERFVFLCIKYNNRWFNASNGEPVKATETTYDEVNLFRGQYGGNYGGGSRDGRGVYRRDSLLSVAPPLAVDFDSGWVAANANSDITITHNLDLTDVPASIVVYASDDATPVLGTDTIVIVDTQNSADGIIIEFTNKDVLEIHVGPTQLWDSGSFGDSSVPSSITNGYIKVKIQK